MQSFIQSVTDTLTVLFMSALITLHATFGLGGAAYLKPLRHLHHSNNNA